MSRNKSFEKGLHIMKMDVSENQLHDDCIMRVFLHQCDLKHGKNYFSTGEINELSDHTKIIIASIGLHIHELHEDSFQYKV